MPLTEQQDLYVMSVWGILFLIGLWHIFAGAATENIFASVRNVRLAGIGLILLSLPCFCWPRPYFIACGILLLLSGLLRAVTPNYNIKIEKRLPRWGHGLVIVAVSALGWLSYQGVWLAH